MDKITEEIITNLIKRVEWLEEKLSRLSVPDAKGFQQKGGFNPGMASPGQLKYLKILKGSTWAGMTKKEAGFEIDRILKEKDATPKEIPEAFEDQKPEPLTKKEVEEIGEENLL